MKKVFEIEIINTGLSMKLDKKLITLLLTLLIVAIAVLTIYAGKPSEYINRLFQIVSSNMGWLYQWFVLLCFSFCLWLCFGPYANVRLGKGVEYSNMSWFTMMFCTGIGSSVMYWGAIEWVYHYNSPPFAIEPKSDEALSWATAYGMLHWGITGWSVYALAAVSFSVLFWREKIVDANFATACTAGLSTFNKKLLSLPLRFIFVLGLFGAVVTSIGVGIPMLSYMATHIFALDPETNVELAIVFVWCVIISISAFTGINKGIKIMSNVNLVLAVVMLFFVVFAGPTQFIFTYFTDSFAILLNNFIKMSLWNDAVEGGIFPKEWTNFYWAWFIAYAPFIGFFVAKISRGRTIREVVIGLSVGGAVGSWIFYAVFGGSGVYYQIAGLLDMGSIVAESGGPSGILQLLLIMPLGKLVLWVFFILAFIFMSTTVDSAAYVLADASVLGPLNEKLLSVKLTRVVWVFLICGASYGLLVVGGLKAVQSFTLLVSLPQLLALALMLYSLYFLLNKPIP